LHVKDQLFNKRYQSINSPVYCLNWRILIAMRR
jgi:hypothetical protein